MSGVLDSKSRVVDVIITAEGKKQLAFGGVDIAYVSFSDASTFYRADVASGSQDATARVYFEACQLPQDQVTFQADDAGNVLPFGNPSSVSQANGRVLSYTYTGVTSSLITGSFNVSASRGDQFTQHANVLLASSLANFQNLMLLSTSDAVFDDNMFLVGPTSVSFSLNDDRPIRDPSQRAVDVSSLDSVFSDPRFSHLPNFKYLPPLNMVNDASVDTTDSSATSNYHLGTYVPWGPVLSGKLSYEQIMYELRYYEQLGYMRKLNIDPTSVDNNVVAQVFEKGFDALKKLDVIDFGVHATGNPSAPVAHVFFVGRVIIDERGTDTFVHLFTLVFE